MTVTVRSTKAKPKTPEDMSKVRGLLRRRTHELNTIDPTDNQTFWTTQEYVGTYGGTWPWATKIASFRSTSHSPNEEE